MTSQAAPRRATLAMMFCDVVGYSRLPDAALQSYWSHVVPRVASVVDKAGHHVKDVNTWGDGLVVVSESHLELARVALELRDLFRTTNWKGIHLPPLKLRIALHTGQVTVGFDPIRKCVGVWGQHVNATARLEPVVTAGSAWATEIYVRLLDSEIDDTIAYDRVGRRELARSFGAAEVFTLRWASDPVAPLVASIGAVSGGTTHPPLAPLQDPAAAPGVVQLDGMWLKLEGTLDDPALGRPSVLVYPYSQHEPSRRWYVQADCDVEGGTFRCSCQIGNAVIGVGEYFLIVAVQPVTALPVGEELIAPPPVHSRSAPLLVRRVS